MIRSLDPTSVSQVIPATRPPPRAAAPTVRWTAGSSAAPTRTPPARRTGTCSRRPSGLQLNQQQFVLRKSVGKSEDTSARGGGVRTQTWRWRAASIPTNAYRSRSRSRGARPHTLEYKTVRTQSYDVNNFDGGGIRWLDGCQRRGGNADHHRELGRSRPHPISDLNRGFRFSWTLEEPSPLVGG